MLARSLDALALMAALLLASTACSSNSPGFTADAGSEGTGCVVAAACPASGAPSYQNDIAPILQQDCVPCHSASGTAGFDETTYAEVANQASPMLDQVSTCAMPPVGGPQLTDAQRTAITAWLKCGAPDN